MRQRITSFVYLVVILGLLAMAAAGCQQTRIFIYAPTFVSEGSRYEKAVTIEATDGKQMSDLVDADIKVPLTP